MPRRKPPPPRGPQLHLADGELSVALVNTAGARPDNRQQGVDNYDQFLTWCHQAGALSAHETERMRRLAAERPAEARAAFAVITTVRSTLAHSFLASQRQKPPAQEILDAFKDALADSSLAMHLVATETGVDWTWTGDEDALDGMLSPILRSAVEVMIAAAGRPHVRQCATEGCHLFFVDRSPTARRRWCDKKTCGHRAANLRFYHRKGKYVPRTDRGFGTGRG